MLKRTLLPALLLLALPAAASAQVFAGSDDFNSGETSKWDYSFHLSGTANATLSFTNNRLDFSSTGGAQSLERLWNSDGTGSAAVTPLSYTTSWVTTITATNTVSGLSGGDFVTTGLSFFNDDNEYFALMLSSTSSGFFAYAEQQTQSVANIALSDNTDVTLRVAWDAGTHLLSASYSTDGSTFTDVTSFNPVTGWNNTTYPVSNGFNFAVFGNTNVSGGVSAGQVYLDNYSVSAVPEPSTYAAIAGALMLGFAAWRRRRVRAA